MPSICAGIGKSIARKLAGQGLNVVLVALQDELLDGTTRELKKAFPKILLRKVRGRSLSFKNNAQLRLWGLHLHSPHPGGIAHVPCMAWPRCGRWESTRKNPRYLEEVKKQTADMKLIWILPKRTLFLC